ncbi:MAG: DUF4159 domain-containing protein [Sneathiella sp.]|nr:DUF4159 domain-containing protein [Sneathiella sp.]
MFTSLLSLTFGNPWLLIALLGLPALYWLIKISPPSPKTVAFSAIQFLLPLKSREETTTSIPWWLLAVRLFIAFLIIVAVAEPKFNAPNEFETKGPAVIFIDNSWAAAPNWDKFEVRLNQLFQQMKDQQNLVYLIPLSLQPTNKQILLNALRPEEAINQALKLQPTSLPLDREQIRPLLAEFRKIQNVSFHWFSNGIEEKIRKDDSELLFSEIADIGPLTVYMTDPETLPLMVSPPEFRGKNTIIRVSKSAGSSIKKAVLVARGSDGEILVQKDIIFEGAQNKTFVSLTLPVQIRNKITSLEIIGSKSAASRYLTDNRHQRKKIGLVSDQLASSSQAFLDENHYLEKALFPYFDLEKEPLTKLLVSDNSIIVLGDTGQYSRKQEDKIKQWINKGGVLVRFAGPKLANSRTSISPVRLRSGSRNLDGSISWTTPAPIGPMPENSLFAHLTIPKDVTVKKQILAVPSIDLAAKTLAILADGTPLVTADQWGAGTIILFHTTASPKWSNLALSGLFVEMLREIGQLATNDIALFSNKATFPPLSLLDGFGKLSGNSSSAEVLELSENAAPRIDFEHPAGYYGTPEYKIALNVGDIATDYQRLNLDLANTTIQPVETSIQTKVMPHLLTLAFLLILVDLLMVLYIQGTLKPRSRLSAIVLLYFISSVLMTPTPASADDIQRILDATLTTRLAYVTTGHADIDTLSQAGLRGLSSIISRRTSVETSAPLAIDIEKNELVFFPFIYWPISEDFPQLSDDATHKINKYLSVGGIILFDTRNQNSSHLYGGVLANSPENIRLKQLLSRIHIPRLLPVPIDHVLTRSFYLMQAFPGRYDAGELWVSDTTDKASNDGVSSVLIGSNDWAAAWATNKDGRPMASVIPGGERQREHARRFGVNLIMYALTGSYKADQVHIPAILDRLSQ